jgi:hypothetical protein
MKPPHAVRDARWFVLAGALAAAVALVGPARSQKSPKPEPCPGARYPIEPPLLPGAEPAGTALRAGATSIALDGACDAIVPARFKATRKGTKVKAKWPACPGFEGKVKLAGKIVDDCTTFTGQVKAKGFKQRIEASRDLLLETKATIGPAGGQIASGDGGLTLDVPAGALADDAAITIRNLDPATLAAAGADAGYALEPDGLAFAVPATATMTLPPVAAGATLEPQLGLLVTAGANDEDPEVLAEQALVFDTVAGEASVSGPLEHFSRVYTFRPRDRTEAQQRARVQLSIEPGTQLQVNQAFQVVIQLIAGLEQRTEKQISHDNTVPPGDRVVYAGADPVVIGTIPLGSSRGGGTVTGYACGPIAGFGAYAAILSAVVEPSIDFGPIEIGGSVSLTTDLQVQILCSVPTTTSTSTSSSTSSSSSSVTVSSTTSTSESTTTTTSTSSTTSTSTSTTSTTSTSTTTIPTLGGCCECGPGSCASGPAIGPEDCPIACAPQSGTFVNNAECNLETGNCDVSAGRAVILTHTIGPFEAGTRLCLHLVRSDPDGCIGVGPECLDEMSNPAPHLHRIIQVIGVGGGIADPIPGGCGHGRVVIGEPGCLPEDPIVPNCF